MGSKRIVAALSLRAVARLATWSSCSPAASDLDDYTRHFFVFGSGTRKVTW